MISHFIPSLKEQAALTTLLTQPHRHYHNINHINDCLAELYKYHTVCETTKDYLCCTEMDVLTYAIWYHDAVYNPYAPAGMNEEQSRQLLSDSFKHSYYVLNNLRWDFSERQQLYDNIKHAIRATANHVETQELNHNLLTKILLDIDLAGFGKPTHIYARNSINIRKEYYNTTELDFVKGRLKFLQKIDQRDSLYYTDYFKDLYHKKSKENIAWEIENLEYAISRTDSNWYIKYLENWLKD